MHTCAMSIVEVLKADVQWTEFNGPIMDHLDRDAEIFSILKAEALFFEIKKKKKK